jgi:hypothetical protein
VPSITLTRPPTQRRRDRSRSETPYRKGKRPGPQRDKAPPKPAVSPEVFALSNDWRFLSADALAARILRICRLAADAPLPGHVWGEVDRMRAQHKFLTASKEGRF